MEPLLICLTQMITGKITNIEMIHKIRKQTDENRLVLSPG